MQGTIKTVRGSHLATQAATLYLLLPIILFILFWFNPFVSVLGIASSLYILIKTLSPPSIEYSEIAARKCNLLICVTVASTLCYACMLTPASISFIDYAKHEAILHDLAVYPWPTTYFSDNGESYILRYSLAYYLVPAGLAKIIGVKYAPPLLLLWNIAGLTIFLLYLTSLVKTRTAYWLSLFVGTTFSGLDILPYLFNHGHIKDIGGALLDSWSRPFSCGWLIGSTPFSLRWTPQHTLSAMLAACVLNRYWQDMKFYSAGAIVLACLVLWSPFVALSFGLMMAAHLLLNRTQGLLSIFTLEAGCALLIFSICGLYIVSSPSGVPAGICTGSEGFTELLVKAAIFCFIEFGAFLIIALAASGLRSTIVRTASMCLIGLLFFRIGSANDLQMRGSQLPIFIIIFFLIQYCETPKSRLRGALLSCMLMLGSVAGIQEILRSPPKIEPFAQWYTPIYSIDWSPTLPGFNYDLAAQYIARVPSGTPMRWMLANAGVKPPETAELSIAPTAEWTEFGLGQFDAREGRVSSATATDASLVSPEFHVEHGIYLIKAVVSWKAKPEVPDLYGNAVHLSIFGQRKLVNISESEAHKRTIQVFADLKDGPLRLAFGLGGWSKAQGTATLHSLHIVRIPDQRD